MEAFIKFLIETINALGYFGVFVGMAIESSFIPFPSEIIMIPAGYLVHEGKMNIYAVILMGILGSLVGAIINYFLGKTLARSILISFGKYFFISENTIQKAESFFQKHGEISTLTGRLLPGIRQIISLPAGAFRMPFFKFLLLTGIGSGIWVTILTFFGFYLGQNADLIKQFAPHLKVGSVVLAVIFVFIYWALLKIKKVEKSS